MLVYCPFWYWVECLMWQFNNHVKVTNRICALPYSSTTNEREKSVNVDPI